MPVSAICYGGLKLCVPSSIHSGLARPSLFYHVMNIITIIHRYWAQCLCYYIIAYLNRFSVLYYSYHIHVHTIKKSILNSAYSKMNNDFYTMIIYKKRFFIRMHSRGSITISMVRYNCSSFQSRRHWQLFLHRCFFYKKNWTMYITIWGWTEPPLL